MKRHKVATHIKYKKDTVLAFKELITLIEDRHITTQNIRQN